MHIHTPTAKIHSNEDKSFYCYNQLNAEQQKRTIKLVVKENIRTTFVSLSLSHTHTRHPYPYLAIYNRNQYTRFDIVHRIIYRSKRAPHAFDGIQISRQMTVAFATTSTNLVTFGISTVLPFAFGSLEWKHTHVNNNNNNKKELNKRN